MYNPYNQSPYSVLGVKQDATKDEVKKAYRDIALQCHPDKLIHIQDSDEKQRRVERFKEATLAYEKLTNNENNFQNMKWSEEEMDWGNVWKTFFGEESKDVLKDVFVDMASMFIKSKIYPKSFYNPTSNLEKPIVHDIKLPVTYNEIRTNAKKKLRLVLVDLQEPIFIEILCGSFPKIIREFTDDNDSDHEIVILMEIKEQDGFNHLISKTGKIDIVTTLEVNLKEYISGYERKIPYIDTSEIDIIVPPFYKEYYEINDKGLKGGSLIVNIVCKTIDRESWDMLCYKEQDEMIRILSLIYNKTI